MRPLSPGWSRCHHSERSWHRLRSVVCAARGLLTLGVTLASIGCAASLAGRSGPIAWQATDLRMVERSVEGTTRDLYTLTLVLQETQGSEIIL
jgi:hypothetical protein